MSDLEDLKNRYIKFLGNLYLNPKIKFIPKSDYVFFYKEYSFLSQSSTSIRLKGFVSDFDGVFEMENTPQLVNLFFKNLAEKNRNIARIFPEIKKDLINLSKKCDIEVPIKRIGKKLKDSKLARDQYLESCLDSFKEFKFVYNSREFISDLYQRGYMPALISGSPKPSLHLIADLLNISRQNVYGTEFIFKGNDFTGEIIPMLGYNKVYAKNIFLTDNISSPSGLHIVVTDDPKLDYPLGADAGLNPSFLISEESKPFSDITVNCYEAKNNLRKLTDLIDRWEIAYVRANLQDPRTFIKILEEKKVLKKYLKACLSENNYGQNTKNFFSQFQRILDLEFPIFPRIYSDIDNLYRKMKTAKFRDQKKLLIKIFNTIKNYTPEFFNFDETEIQQIARELDEKYPNHVWCHLK